MFHEYENTVHYYVGNNVSFKPLKLVNSGNKLCTSEVFSHNFDKRKRFFLHICTSHYSMLTLLTTRERTIFNSSGLIFSLMCFMLW